MYDDSLRVRLAVAPGPAQLGPVLTAAGLTIDPHAATGVVISSGRSTAPAVEAAVDRWIVESTPHLLVAAHPHGIEVGPWVLPGVSPCVHCVAAATLSAPADELPALPPALWSLAAGWIARDLQAWLRGESPSTWATSWFLGAEPLPRSRRWQRHPYCGCAWFDL